jgi:hypothetical protein
MRYKRITLEEREEIFRLRYEERLPLREIGERQILCFTGTETGHKKQAVQSGNRRGEPPEREAAAVPEIKDDW